MVSYLNTLGPRAIASLHFMQLELEWGGGGGGGGGRWGGTTTIGVCVFLHYYRILGV